MDASSIPQLTNIQASVSSYNASKLVIARISS
jgi:hypothetical protein